MIFLDKYGWPVETIKGRPVVNVIRIILHTRSVRRGKWVDAAAPDANVAGSLPASEAPKP